jgi:hypothetical protein
MEAKRTDTTQKAFSKPRKLKKVVDIMYCGYNPRTMEYSPLCSPELAEKIVTVYGWPIHPQMGCI